MSETWLDFISASVIGVMVWFFGGLDDSLKVLIAMSIVDYCSGVSVAWMKGIVNSRTGFSGILKKIIMFSLVGVGNLIDRLLPGGSDAVRTVVVLFFVANEGLSIMENASKLGVPFPTALKKHFEQLQAGHEDKNEEEHKNEGADKI